MQKNRCFPFILAANRDEYYQRPTAPAQFWPDCAHLLAGRDLIAQGTWLGVTLSGKVAAVTNHYTPNSPADTPCSRGTLVSRFLSAEHTQSEYAEEIRASQDQFNGYGLIFGDFTNLRYQSNRSKVTTDLLQGIHVLSNSHLNSPWPRVETGRLLLSNLLKSESKPHPDQLFELLADKGDSKRVVDTGKLSNSRQSHPCNVPIFVSRDGYGTRNSTVILVDRHQNVYFEERTFNSVPGDNLPAGARKEFRFKVPASAEIQ